MCIPINNIRKNINEVIDKKNQKGIHKDSFNYKILYFLYILGCVGVVIMCYFLITSMWIFGTYITMSPTYNISTGCKYNDTACNENTWTKRYGWCREYSEYSEYDSCSNSYYMYQPIFCSLYNTNTTLGKCFLVGCLHHS